MQIDMMAAQIESLQKQVQILTLQSTGGHGGGHGSYAHGAYVPPYFGGAPSFSRDVRSVDVRSAVRMVKGPTKRFEFESPSPSMQEILYRAKEFNGYSSAAYEQQHSGGSGGGETIAQPKTMATKIFETMAKQGPSTAAAPTAPAAAAAATPTAAPTAAPAAPAAVAAAVPVAAAATPAAQQENAISRARRTKTRMNHETFLEDLYSVAYDDGDGSLLVQGAILPRYIWPLDRDGQAYEGCVFLFSQIMFARRLSLYTYTLFNLQA